jgi:hypothetical protein
VAILTKTIVEFGGGSCVWSYDYDDVALRLVQIRCTNASEYPTRGTVTVISNGRTFSALVGPGDSLDQALPSTTQTRLGITIDALGRVDGIDHSIEWGAAVR